jgi:hypothetical protein
MAKNQGMDNIPQIQLGDNEINNPNEIVNAFNKYFITIDEKLSTVDSAKNEAIRILDSFKADNMSEMRLIPTTETEIKCIVKTLKIKNSAGYDGISSRILKNCMDVISKPLIHIINESFKQSIYPERLKYALVRPIYKMGERTDISNYRPISLLTTFSKIFERVMCAKLYQHIQVSNIIAPEQYGFR